MQTSKYNLITVLGPTATGKTGVAVALANEFDSEVISADSRQIYRGMDLGTGKDIDEYEYNGSPIPYHLIDIADAGYKYNVFEYQQDFIDVYKKLQERNIVPILCGGTGLYLEAVLDDYNLVQAPENKELRAKLGEKDLDELVRILSNYTELHNTTDTKHKKRVIRAIEIAEYSKENPLKINDVPKLNSLIIGINYERETVRQRITLRLKQRIEAGMIEEVEELLRRGVDNETLLYYGLEYKFITMYLNNDISYDELFTKLNIAIHQFSKRQMTWFRRMEKKGFDINWIDGNLPIEEKVQQVKELFYQTA